MADRVLVVTHVPWEGPHRIAEVLKGAGFELVVRSPLAGDALPTHAEVAGAVFMGGPMNVDQVDRVPELLAEREWLAEAIDCELPVLGVCLGAQLIARAAGAEVTPGAAPEIGWDEVRVHALDDPLLCHLAPSAQVLHWHGDIFNLPDGAKLLASSARTQIQAFRIANAWGLLFHAEADSELVATWLAEPSMREEAEAALGLDASERIARDANTNDSTIRERSAPLFAAFAEQLVSARRK